MILNLVLLGDLAQASPNLVAMINWATLGELPRIDAVITAVHQLTGHVADIQSAPESPVISQGPLR
jgi:hypothetical protein